MNKQPKVTEQTKKNIVQAFWKLFKKKRIDQITVKEISDIAGYNRSTFYEYFTNIRDILEQEEGQVVAVGQKLVTIVQNNELEVEINVPENRIDQLKSAKEINVKLWALPDVKVKGTLREVSPVANDASRTYKVRISLIDPPSNIKIGMSSNVSISNNNSYGKIWIPLAAVYQKDSSLSVWIVKEDKVALKNITVEDLSSDEITVTSGLNEGDVVVTAGITKLREGQKVRIGSDK